MENDKTVIEYIPSFQDIFLTPKYLAGTVLLFVTTIVGALIPPAVAYLRSKKAKIRLTNERLIVEEL